MYVCFSRLIAILFLCFTCLCFYCFFFIPKLYVVKHLFLSLYKIKIKCIINLLPNRMMEIRLLFYWIKIKMLEIIYVNECISFMYIRTLSGFYIILIIKKKRKLIKCNFNCNTIHVKLFAQIHTHVFRIGYVCHR